MSQVQRVVPKPIVYAYSQARVPTEYGELRVVVYREASQQQDAPVEHCALICGEPRGAESLLVRVHSECFTGEVLRSLKCDCLEQLDQALRRICDAGAGIVIYLRQEGRGIGLGNKIRAYALQAQGADTVDANLRLGFEADARRYHVASGILVDLGVESIALLTNNPAKVSALRADGIIVSGRVPMDINPNHHNRDYLVTKNKRMGHEIDLE